MFREQIRTQAAERFAVDEDNAAVAKALRVHVRSVQRWRAAWKNGGEAALVSNGPPNYPQLSEAQFAILEAELERGPVAHGWPDQTWTLDRIKTVIGRRFHKSYTVAGVHYLLRRHGWSHQVLACRAIERDETDRDHRLDQRDLAGRGNIWAALGAWLVFEDEAGFSMTPPIARTWSRRGCTPIIRVRGRSRRRLSVAALVCPPSTTTPAWPTPRSTPTRKPPPAPDSSCEPQPSTPNTASTASNAS